MKLLILGATGRTGQELVRQSLDKGYEVHALVRNPAKITMRHPFLTVIHGDVLDKNLLAETIDGKDAVISALGLGRSLKSNDLIFNVAGLLVPAMQEKKVSRLIFLSAFGVGETFPQANWLQKLAFRIPLKNLYDDKARAETIIKNSDLDWTLVYPVVLTDKPAKGNYQVGDSFPMKGFPKVSRADVAHFMIEEVESNKYVRKCPVIM